MKLKFIGTDLRGRLVFLDSEGNKYKKYADKDTVFTADRLEGEPIKPVVLEDGRKFDFINLPG